MQMNLAHGCTLRIATCSAPLGYYKGSTKRMSLVSLAILFLEFQLTRRH